MSSFVHPTAIIDEGVEIGEGAKIWHFTHVSEGARIGADASLGQNCFVGRGVRIGDGARVQNNVSIYEEVEVEAQAFLGPSCVFTNVSNPRAFVSRKHEYRPTRVGKGASVGANAVIICGNELGNYCFVGAGAVVTRSVPPHALVVGNPARQIGWMSRAGVRLPEGTHPVCPETGDYYLVDDQGCRFIEEPQTGIDSVAVHLARLEQSGVEFLGAHLTDDIPTEDASIPMLSSSDQKDWITEETNPLASEPIAFLDLEAQNQPLLQEIQVAIAEVIRNNQFILGKTVKAFEEEVAKFLGVEHAIGVSSGTDALLVSLMALGIGEGDEVITTPFTFFATAGVIARLGATPVFVDIDPETFNLDPGKVAAALTENTRAIMPVHLFGQACPIAALRRAAPGIPIVEDAAQAIGAVSAEGKVGGLGDLACFSFFPSKNLGAFGDGGLVTTNDTELAERVRRLRVHGSFPKYYHAMIGGNFRLDAIQAAVLRVKLPHLSHWNEARRRNAAHYDELFLEAGLKGVQIPIRRVPGHAFNQYVIRAPRRDELAAFLRDRAIGNAIYYPLSLHRQECFAHLDYDLGALPESERAAREVLALPIYAEVGPARQERVVNAIIEFYGKAAEAKISTKIQVVQGSVTDTKLDADVLVNASNTLLQLGTGVSAAIASACGQPLIDELQDLREGVYSEGIECGSTLVTGAGDHPRAKHVAHVAVMDYREGPTIRARPDLDRLKQCYTSLWTALEELDSPSVVAVALGSGTGGLGLRDSVRIACETLKSHHAAGHSIPGRVAFVAHRLHEYVNTVAVVHEHFELDLNEIDPQVLSLLDALQ